MKKLWSICKAIFWLVFIVAALAVIISSVKLFGYSMFVVKSGSMEPAIHTGSVVFDKTDGDYAKGDIITFKVSESKDTVTHRIVEIKKEDNAISYKVKGDANDTADPDLVLKDNVVGKVIFSIPYFGYLVAFMKTLPGLIIFIILPSLIVVYGEIDKIKKEIDRMRNKEDKLDKEIEQVEKEEEKIEKELEELKKKENAKESKKPEKKKVS